MSNLANTIQYLKGKDNRFITITVQETNKSIGKANVYLEDIPGENLEQYIKDNLGPVSKPTLVWVEMRSKQGTTSKKDHACPIEILPAHAALELPTQNSAAQAIVPPMYPQVQHPSPSFLGSPNGGNVFGLGVAEIIGMQVKADRLNHKEEQLADLKEDFKELKKNYDKLDIEHRATLTKLSTSEAQKEMAVMMAKLENKSFFDSPAFTAMMDKAPEMLSGIIAMKTGGVPLPAAGALGAALPESHRQLIDYIVESLDETQVNFLGSVCRYLDNDLFTAQLRTLIQQFAHA